MTGTATNGFGAEVSSAVPLGFGWRQADRATGVPAWAVRREGQAAARRSCGRRRPAPLPSAKVSCRAAAGWQLPAAHLRPDRSGLDACGIGGGIAWRGQRSISSDAQANPLASRNRAAKPVGSPSARQRSIEALIVGRGGAAQRQRDRPEPQLEQPVAARGLGVVVALRRGDAQDLDLARIETEALVDRARLRLQRAVVGQEDARRTAFDQRRGDGRALDVGQRLGGEHDGDVLLAQRLQPLADAGREQRVVEEGPGLVEDQQRRPAVETRLQPLEQIGQHGRDQRLVLHQRFHLEMQHVARCQALRRAVEQAAVGTFQACRAPAPPPARSTGSARRAR